MEEIKRGTIWSLVLLASGFFVSNIYRTLSAIMVLPLQRQLEATTWEVTVYAAAFHLVFGIVQIGAGVSVDRWGLKKTALYIWPFTIVGSMLPLIGHDMKWLIASQIMIGVGCTPAFLVCTVYIARAWGSERYSTLTAAVMAGGSAGMLVAATPLVWVMKHWGWRGTYVVLFAAACLSMVCMARSLKDIREVHTERKENEGQRKIWRRKYTYGMIGLGVVVYGSFMALRTLWIGPLMEIRYQWGDVEIGNLILVITIIAIISIPICGGLGRRRQRKIYLKFGGIAMAIAYMILAIGINMEVDIAMMSLIGGLSGLVAIEYADAREEYAEKELGRALAILAAALFLGVAGVQGVTGIVAEMGRIDGNINIDGICWAMALIIISGVYIYVKNTGVVACVPYRDPKV